MFPPVVFVVGTLLPLFVAVRRLIVGCVPSGCPLSGCPLFGCRLSAGFSPCSRVSFCCRLFVVFVGVAVCSSSFVRRVCVCCIGPCGVIPCEKTTVVVAVFCSSSVVVPPHLAVALFVLVALSTLSSLFVSSSSSGSTSGAFCPWLHRAYQDMRRV